MSDWPAYRDTPERLPGVAAFHRLRAEERRRVRAALRSCLPKWCRS